MLSWMRKSALIQLQTSLGKSDVSWPWFSARFFGSQFAESGGFTDYNAFHDAEPAIDEKWIAQQFIWSHPLEWSRVLDAENLLPPGE